VPSLQLPLFEETLAPASVGLLRRCLQIPENVEKVLDEVVARCNSSLLYSPANCCADLRQFVARPSGDLSCSSRLRNNALSMWLRSAPNQRFQPEVTIKVKKIWKAGATREPTNQPAGWFSAQKAQTLSS